MGVYDAYGRIISNGGDDWPALAARLAAGGYEEEFVICDRLDPETAAAVAAAGFMPMSATLVTPDGPRSFLTPKLHLMRCLADPASIRPTRTALGRSSRYSVALKLNFGAAIAGCVRIHGDGWLTEPLVRAFTALAAEPPRDGRPVFLSAELYADGGPAGRRLVAAEIGYALGSSYASLSGFSDESGAGTVQLYALAGLLAELGVTVWDLGMPLPYKLALGGREYSRDSYLPALIKAYRRATPPALAAARPPEPARPLLDSLRRRTRADSA
jgi:Leu/Phe-tRNA-protein transferase